MKSRLEKKPRLFQPAICALLVAWVSSDRLAAASVVVDWLEPANTSSGSDLIDDNGRSRATIDLRLVTGIADLEDFGTSRIDDSHWGTDPDFENMATGDATLPLITNRVFPQSGVVEMSVEITTVPSRSKYFLAIGEINPGANPVITVTGLGVGDTVIFRNATSWDSGFGANDGTLTWDQGARSLGTSASSNQSGMAFLELDLLSSKTISVNYQTSSSSPTGDRIVMAVGVAIPEPSGAVMLALSTLVFVSRRRRSQVL